VLRGRLSRMSAPDRSGNYRHSSSVSACARAAR
jgi:hypothetical protein